MIVSLLKLMRLYYSLPFAAGFLVILSYLTAGNLQSVRDRSAWAFGSLFLVISAGYVFNDVCDIRVDQINAPRRVLPAGRLKRKTALGWAVLLFGAGLICGLFCEPAFFFGIAAVALLLIVYDLYSKRMGLWKDLFVAALMTSLYPLAFTVASPVQSPRLPVLLIHPVWLFLTAFGYEMLKDIRDSRGDAGVEGSRIAACSRRSWFLLTARICILMAGIITLVPYLLGYCKEIYLAVSIMAIMLAGAAIFLKPAGAIRCIYVQVFLITAGSMADLQVFGP